jgi:L-ascorbate metabolism protein UlaG (beta-lactamase superfamily)
MKVTYYGHSCFAVDVAGKRLLFDPFIRPNPKAASVDVSRITADYLLLSHGHFDHMADAAYLAKQTSATVIANYEITEWFAKSGTPKVHGMNLGGACRFDFGRVKLVPALHSSTLPDGTPAGNPGGFVIETAEGNFYYSGDTALTLDMKLIGESAKLKFAALCIGDNFTMGVDDAVKAAGFIQCDQILGVHYDTFPPIAINHDEAKAAFRAVGKTLHLLPVGGQHVF